MRKEKKIGVYEKKPKGFKASVEVAGCYLEIDGKVLFLKQGTEKVGAGAWGVPGGKLEKDETPEEAALRELFEETAIRLEKPMRLQPLGCLYVQSLSLDFIFYLFEVKLKSIPKVLLSEEHQSYRWVPIQTVYDLNLLSGGNQIFDFYQKQSIKCSK
ncbi:MAG: NUDIX hydrolase [Chlamydiales bacterium]